MGIQTTARSRERLVVTPAAELTSPGRLYTQFLLDRYEGDHRAWLAARMARHWAEVVHLLRHGLWTEAARLRARIEEIERWHCAHGGARWGTLAFSGNLALNEGWDNDCWLLIIGAASQTAFNNTNARLGVGDSTTAASASQTDLQAASNKTYKAMNASFPAPGGAGTRRMDFKSTFTTADANYAWEEVIVDNGATDGTTMFRRVQSLGTKTSAAAWDLTAQVTIT
jgi:hypothetical protein